MPYALNERAALWRIVDGEAVIVSLETTYYYGLNRTGTLVWTWLAESPAGADDLARRLAGEYGIDVERATDDVRSIVHHLLSEGLITET
jgi:hypothetical protein